MENNLFYGETKKIMNKKIYWISSYPKSGNTWMRAIVSSFIFNPEGNFNFNLLKFIEQFEKEKWFNFLNSNLNENKNLSDIKFISKYWIEAQERIILEDNYNLLYNFFKTHSLNGILNNNQFTNSKISGGVIYLVRDPRDVAVSFSKHRGESIDATIDFMTNKSSMFPYENNRIPTLLSRWDYHYISWTKLDVPKLFIKYEDLINDTKTTLLNINNFLKKQLKLDINVNEKKIENILLSTKFEKLKELEKQFGFSEATKNSSFFRKGEILQWEKKLSKNQINKIEKEFKQTMKILNYV